MIAPEQYFPFVSVYDHDLLSNLFLILEYKGKPSCWANEPNLELLSGSCKDVFERHTSTGSEAFSLYICLDANKFVLLSFFSLIKTIYSRVWSKPLPCDAKSPLSVDARRLKALLTKLTLRLFPSHGTALFSSWPDHYAANFLSESAVSVCNSVYVNSSWT